MEDQIALFGFEGNRGFNRTGLAMRDGFFYISDGNGGKIVCYNSFGDLLFMIYNEEIVPGPVNLRPRTDDDTHVVRWAFTHPFLSPGRIAVNSRRHIFVEERMPGERHRIDPENNVILDSIVLHFDESGRFIEYFGQGGPGGGPLPRITGLFTSINDEVVVVCRIANGWDVYWYSAWGEQLFLVRFSNDTIPVPEEWQAYSASVESIMAAPDERKLYIKVAYFRSVYDDVTGTRVSREPAGSLIWIFNLDTGAYENPIHVPFFEYRHSDRGRRESTFLFYSMKGVARGGRVLLYSPIDTGYEILMIFPNGFQQRALIRVDPEELRFNYFHFSPEGILSALLADEWEARLVWWRLDRLAARN